MELSIQERLKDLRVERGLTLEQLEEQVNLSKSALGSYEAKDFKDISHYAIIKLAKFYGVTADYLLGLSQTRNHPNADLADLRLSDDMIELLKSGLVDNSLLCELAAHPDFPRLMADLEVYVNGVAGKQVQSANAMLYDRSIQVSNTNRISVYDELSTFFIAFHFRGTCLSLDEFNDLHGFHFEKDPTNFNIDHLISLCEYIENLLIAYQCVSLSYPYEYGNMPTNLINVQFYLQQISQVIEKIGYMQAKQNDLTIFVEKDPAAIAVAEGEFIPESLSYRLISYNHYSMKGNLAEKKTTLLDLANLLEPQRTILERIDKTFSSDLFYTFNNFHIRHNNIDQLGTKYKKPVGDLSDEQLEYWYDEVYQMCLLAFMRLEHIDRKKKFDSLKSQIEGT